MSRRPVGPLTAPAVALATALLGGCAAPAMAQELSFRAGWGRMAPLGDGRELWDTGNTASLGMEWESGGAWALRAAAEWGRLRGRESGPSSGSELSIRGATLSALLKDRRAPIQPYLLAGAGVMRLDRGGASSPYGTTAAAQVGVGIDGPPRYRVLPFLEARAVVHLTDYGSGGDFRLTRTGTPIMVGVRVRW